MRILLLTHSFNSLTQRLYVELGGRGHELSVEFDIHPDVTTEAVALYQPDLIIASFMKRAIPETVWRHHRCLIVHPGIRGDRGPSALDWAILEGRDEWGVTVLQANAEMDAGDVWASVPFPMREATKASLYRNEVTEAAVTAVLTAIERIEAGEAPEPLESTDTASADGMGRWHPLMRQPDRAIAWERDDTATILRKIRAADSHPGVLDALEGGRYYLYGAHREPVLRGAVPGAVIAQYQGAICRATIDGAVWITHMKRHDQDHPTLKLPAAELLAEHLRDVPTVTPGACAATAEVIFPEIRYEEAEGVGFLYFDFHNGAMGTNQCCRLLDAWREARERDTRVLVLMGGHDFWSNGIHLNLIEAAESPADESWRNINAMDDLARAILETDDRLTVAALRGNAGAGGVFLALAADQVYARRGVLLNPHYRNMGNLYGSEYWTYLLPRRVGEDAARRIMEGRLPMDADQARRLGLIDECFGEDRRCFEIGLRSRAQQIAAQPRFGERLAGKNRQRRLDEQARPLADYRHEELERMKLNFYGFDPSYHVARYHFVYKVDHSWTPLHLARHRLPGRRPIEKRQRNAVR